MADTDDTPSATEEPAPKPELGDAGKKALDEERKARREAEKALTDLRAKLKEFEDRDKSDSEKAAEALKAAEARAAQAEAKALRLEVAAAKGLTLSQAKRLVGTTKEELEADADEILETFGAAGAKPPPSRKPAAALRGGTEPDEQPEETDPAKLAASVPRY